MEYWKCARLTRNCQWAWWLWAARWIGTCDWTRPLEWTTTGCCGHRCCHRRRRRHLTRSTRPRPVDWRTRTMTTVRPAYRSVGRVRRRHRRPCAGFSISLLVATLLADCWTRPANREYGFGVSVRELLLRFFFRHSTDFPKKKTPHHDLSISIRLMCTLHRADNITIIRERNVLFPLHMFVFFRCYFCTGGKGPPFTFPLGFIANPGSRIDGFHFDCVYVHLQLSTIDRIHRSVRTIHRPCIPEWPRCSAGFVCTFLI